MPNSAPELLDQASIKETKFEQFGALTVGDKNFVRIRYVRHENEILIGVPCGKWKGRSMVLFRDCIESDLRGEGQSKNLFLSLGLAQDRVSVESDACVGRTSDVPWHTCVSLCRDEICKASAIV